MKIPLPSKILGARYEPTYRDGDIVVAVANASVRRGDRVILKTVHEEFLIRQLRRRSARRLELDPIAGDDVERIMDVEDCLWMARIIWVSQ